MTNRDSIKHSHFTYILVSLFFLIMWYIAGWSTDNWDWIPYEIRYDDSSEISIMNTLDIGFVYVNQYLASLGLSFMQYRQVVYLAFLSFIMIIILKYSKTPILTSLVYFVILFFRDIILMRNTLALLFFTIAVFCYLSNSIKHNKTLFVLFWIVSCTFHFSFLIYGFFLLAGYRIGTTPVIITSLGLGIIGSMIFSNLMGLNVLMGLTDLQDRADGYLSTGSYISLIICSITVLFNYYVISKFTHFNKHYSNINIELFKRVNLFLFPVIIFTSINMEFLRLYNNFFLVNYIVLANINTSNRIPVSGHLLFFGWFVWSFLWITVFSGVGPQVALILESIK